MTIPRERGNLLPSAPRYIRLTRLLCFLLSALILLGSSLVPLARAEDPRKPYALIFGTVWGPDDRPVYGVKVKIRLAAKKRAKWELFSDHQGEFAQRVPAQPADYVVWTDVKDLNGIKSPSGKQLEPGSEVTVHISGDERQDIGVHLK